MRLKFLRSSSSAGLSYAIMIYLIAFILYSVARADEFTYFRDEIDYWSIPSKPQNKSEKSPRPKSEDQPQQKFSWEKHLDPRNKEFFKEGDYTPPEPFMEIVRDPSDENLKLWFSYIDKRNELYQRLQKRMEEFKGTSGPIAVHGELNRRMNQIQVLEPEAKRYRFRFYFDSKCPHCKKMNETMRALVAKGFLVEGVQVDQDNSVWSQMPFPVRSANKKELDEKSVASVPLLLVGDLKNKVVFRLSGYQSFSDVMASLKANL